MARKPLGADGGDSLVAIAKPQRTTKDELAGSRRMQQLLHTVRDDVYPALQSC